jgi:hypothetical protein
LAFSGGVADFLGFFTPALSHKAAAIASGCLYCKLPAAFEATEANETALARCDRLPSPEQMLSKGSALHKQPGPERLHSRTRTKHWRQPPALRPSTPLQEGQVGGQEPPHNTEGLPLFSTSRGAVRAAAFSSPCTGPCRSVSRSPCTGPSGARARIGPCRRPCAGPSGARARIAPPESPNPHVV